jgi:hypothetical protein
MTEISDSLVIAIYEALGDDFALPLGKVRDIAHAALETAVVDTDRRTMERLGNDFDDRRRQLEAGFKAQVAAVEARAREVDRAEKALRRREQKCANIEAAADKAADKVIERRMGARTKAANEREARLDSRAADLLIERDRLTKQRRSLEKTVRAQVRHLDQSEGAIAALEEIEKMIRSNHDVDIEDLRGYVRQALEEERKRHAALQRRAAPDD